ncbi:hypothetical protein QUF65_19775 [Lysinibacillus sphaericus]|nr:hypothetical protein [Lysinibacillus sphaericus]
MPYFQIFSSDVNRPSLWKYVERLAPFTEGNPVPDYEKQSGFIDA